jgi:hypothetical protein
VINEEELKSKGLGPERGVGFDAPVSDIMVDFVFARSGGDDALEVDGLLDEEWSSCGEKNLLSRNLGLGGGTYSSPCPSP